MISFDLEIIFLKVIKRREFKKQKRRRVYINKKSCNKITIEYILNILKECLNLEKCEVIEYSKIGGMTNENYKIETNNKVFILRLPGIGVDNLINRKNEVVNSKLLIGKNIDAEILYINEKTGIKISKYIEESETLTVKSSRKKENIKLVSNIIKRLHNLTIEMNNIFNPFDEIRKYEDIIYENKYIVYDGYKNIRKKVLKLEDIMNELDVRLVPSHNDTVPENFIKDSKGNVYLIDWEYSGMNDEMWDIAAYSLESEFSNSDEELLLNYYLEGNIKENHRKKILINKILQDILWSLWSVIKKNQGVDYGYYGEERYKRGLNNLNYLYKIINDGRTQSNESNNISSWNGHKA